MPNVQKVSRAEQKARRPGQILDAAFEEFVERGYMATRVEDIADRIDVTKGTIYVYFETKEELFSAMIRHISMPFEEILASGRDLEGNYKQRLQTLIEILYDNFLENRRLRELLRFVIAEGHRFPHVVDEHHALFIHPLINFMQSVIDDGVKAGEFRPGPAAVSDMAMAPIMLAMIFKLLFDDRRSLDRNSLIASHLDMLFNGLLA